MLIQEHPTFVNNMKHNTRWMSSGKCTTFVYTTFHVPFCLKHRYNPIWFFIALTQQVDFLTNLNQILAQRGCIPTKVQCGPKVGSVNLSLSLSINTAALVKCLALHLLINSSKCIYCKQPLWDGIQLRGDAEHPLVPPRSQAEDCSR